MADLFNRLQSQLKGAATNMKVESPFADIGQFFSGPASYQRGADAAGALMKEAGVQTNYQDQLRQDQIRKLKEEREGLANPQYERVAKESGYDYFKVVGNERVPVSAFEYAQETGVGLDKALEGSTNPDDYLISDEFFNVKDYMVTKLIPEDQWSEEDRQSVTGADRIDESSTNRDLVDYMEKKYPWIKKSKGNDALLKFMQIYPHMFRRDY